MKRIEWIDSLKGFGIFCVTLGHLSCHYLIETHIYSFHMFLFFFLSGFLHNNARGDFKKYIAKKTKSLFVPFLVWNLLSSFAGLFMGITVSETVKLFFLLDGVVCWNSPIWFLLLLYLTEIVYFFMENYVPHGKWLSVPSLAILWVFVSEKNVFLKLNILPVCLLFYTLGNVFKQILDKYITQNKKKDRFAIPAAVLCLCANICFGIVLNKRITFTGADFGNVFYCAIAAISGTLFYVILFRNVRFLRTNKVLSYLGKNSLIIMAAQYWFFKFYDAISQPLLGGSVWRYRNTGKALLMSAFTMALICVIAELFKKISAKNRCIKRVCHWFGIMAS